MRLENLFLICEDSDLKPTSATSTRSSEVGKAQTRFEVLLHMNPIGYEILDQAFLVSNLPHKRVPKDAEHAILGSCNADYTEST